MLEGGGGCRCGRQTKYKTGKQVTGYQEQGKREDREEGIAGVDAKPNTKQVNR